MYLYYPTDVLNMIIKYSPKELVNYLKDKDYNWPRLYYELYGEKTPSIQHKYPEKYGNKYLDGIINRIDRRYNCSFIAEGERHKMKLMEDGSVLVKGSNSNGQLGLGQCIIQSEWKKINLPEKAIQIECGGFYSMILLENGKVLGTGCNSRNQLGLYCKTVFTPRDWIPMKLQDKIVKISCSYDCSSALSENGKVFVTDPFLDGWKKLRGIKNIIQFECISHELILLSNNGKIYKCEIDIVNNQKLHEIFKLDEKIIWMNCGFNNTDIVILTETGEVYNTPLVMHRRKINWTKMEIPAKVVQIAHGYNHMLLLLNTGKVQAYGNNLYGQLGIGHKNRTDVCEKIMITKRVKHVACGPNCSMVTLENNRKFITNNKGGWDEYNELTYDPL